MKRVVSLSAAFAAIAVALASWSEGEPEVRARISYDSNRKQWDLTGEVQFFRGGRLVLFGWKSWGATRRAPFELTLPSEGGWLTKEMYEPQAIDAAKLGGGDWEWNYWTLLVEWLIVFISFLAAWWVFRSYFGRREIVVRA